MAAISTAPPPWRAPVKPRRNRSLARAGWPTYVIAFFFVGICIAPVLYIVLGGLRTNSQITTDPSGLAMRDVRGANVKEEKGSCPSTVYRRVIFICLCVQ